MHCMRGGIDADNRGNGEKARVSVVTLRRWERTGRFASSGRTAGNHRRYVEPAIGTGELRQTILYARVSGHDQKADLERQKQRLLQHAEEPGWRDVTAITDLGSGMNCRKAGLLRLLGMKALPDEVANSCT